VSREREGGADGVEGHIEVVRSARYWTLGRADGPAETWFVLHGYAQLARRFLRRFRALAGPSCLVVAPEGLSRFYIASGEDLRGAVSGTGGASERALPRAGARLVGATWMTREDREAEIRDYVAYLDRLTTTVARAPTRTTVLGFSQGVATAWRWITYGTVPGLVRLVAWAGDVPHDLDLARAAQALAGVEIVLVTGAGDGTVPTERIEEAEERLTAAGIPYSSVRYGGGHDIDEGTLLGIARGGTA